MKADALTYAARVLDSRAATLADGGMVDGRSVQTLRVMAADMRAEAQSCNGYGTPATLALAITLDNDRDLYERRQGIVAHALADAGEVPIADVADALRDWCEALCGMEGVAVGSREVRGDGDGGHALCGPMLNMMQVALCDVDWIGLAEHYMSEEG